MPSRDTWKALQAELVRAHSLLEAGDRPGALAAVDAALAIDSEFLAAQALRERILAAPDSGVARIGRIPPEMPPGETEAQPVEHRSAASTPLVSSDGYRRFEQRVKRRRVDRQIEAAGAALDRGQIAEASAAVVEIAALDMNSPELASLSRRLDKMRRAVPRSHQARRLAAAVAGGCMLGGSYFYPGWQAIPSWQAVSWQAAPSYAEATYAYVEATYDRFVEVSHHQINEIRALATREQVTNFLAKWSSNRSEPDKLVGVPVESSTTQPHMDISAAQKEEAAARGPQPVVKPPEESPRPRPRPNSIVTQPVTPSRFGGPPQPVQVGAVVSNGRPNDSVPPAPVPSPPAPAAVVVSTASVPPNDGITSTVEPYSSTTAASLSVAADTAESSSTLTRAPSAPIEAPAAPAARVEDDESLVKEVLQRYRRAYAGLDARLAREVWPQVDEAALARAFDGLLAQQLTFDHCNLVVDGAAASAVCRGSTRYVPKVGSRDPHIEPRVWNFSLRKTGAEWSIERARAER